MAGSIVLAAGEAVLSCASEKPRPRVATAPNASVLAKTFRRLLKPAGLLVLGDIIPKVSAVSEAVSLLRFAAQEGFFFAAVLGLVRTALSNYAQLRSTLGLAHYDEGAMIARLATAGFAAKRAAENIGHNPARMTFVARPR